MTNRSSVASDTLGIPWVPAEINLTFLYCLEVFQLQLDNDVFIDFTINFQRAATRVEVS